MAVNNSPVFPIVPKVGWCLLTSVNGTASKTHDGTGVLDTDIFSIYTAGSNGGRVDRIKVSALGTNTATVLRIFVNNGSVNTTAANNALFEEKTLAATTIIETAELVDYEITMNLPIPAGYRILVCLGTAVSAGWKVVCSAGDY